METNKIIEGDCMEVLKTMPENSVDAIVTDPPYLLEFMSKKWDKANTIEPSFGFWLAGFVDGEGCFRIHRVRNGDYYECHFQLKLRSDDKKILEEIQRTLGFGRIQDNKADGNSKPTSSFIITSRDGCFKLAEVFLLFPLKAKKQIDFFKWYEALLNWDKQKKGNRWKGKPDVSAMEANWLEMKKLRNYDEIKIPVNKNAFFHYLWAKECLRVLKPGGYLLSMGGTRTYHRMTQGIEDAGFEIRDCIMHIYGSGFPKSLDISKAIDKMKGAERTEIKSDRANWEKRWLSNSETPNINPEFGFNENSMTRGKDSPARFIMKAVTHEAKQWNGWGTALKPACEPIVVARKPLSEKSVALNVLKWGTGGINIDGGRIGVGTGKSRQRKAGSEFGQDSGWNDHKNIDTIYDGTKGRFPSNVILNPESAEALDQQSGELKSGDNCRRTKEGYFGEHGGLGKAGDIQLTYGDSGGASRFFYVAKASRTERNMGLEGKEQHKGGTYQFRQDGSLDGKIPIKKNLHPTVKPVQLMRYLVRLVTPKNGIVLDPFIGSGTTGIACLMEGFKFMGIEKEPEYVKIARARIAYVPKRLDNFIKKEALI